MPVRVALAGVGNFITVADLQEPAGSRLWRLRREQDAMFHAGLGT